MVDRNLNYGRDIVARWVEELPVETAIELGPGQGTDLEAIRAAHPRARIIALESYPPFVEGLRARGYDVIAADLERHALPLADDSVDLIVANQVLEHVKELFWTLHESSRVLRVGGSFIVGVPNIAAAHNRLLMLLGRQPTQQRNWSARVRGYTKHDLVEVFTKPFPGGFRLAASAGANFYPLPPLLARPAARLWPGGAWGFFGRFEKIAPYRDEFLRWPVHERLETNFYLGTAAGDG